MGGCGGASGGGGVSGTANSPLSWSSDLTVDGDGDALADDELCDVKLKSDIIKFIFFFFS